MVALSPLAGVNKTPTSSFLLVPFGSRFGEVVGHGIPSTTLLTGTHDLPTLSRGCGWSFGASRLELRTGRPFVVRVGILQRTRFLHAQLMSALAGARHSGAGGTPASSCHWSARACPRRMPVATVQECVGRSPRSPCLAPSTRSSPRWPTPGSTASRLRPGPALQPVDPTPDQGALRRTRSQDRDVATLPHGWIRPMAEPHSSTMQRILDILTIANTGDRRRARDEFAALWNTLPARVGSDWLANAGPSPRSASTAKRGSGQPRVDVGRRGGRGVRVAGDVPTEMPVSRSSTCAGRLARILRLPCCRTILAASLAADTDPGAARMRWLDHESLFPSE